MTLRGGYGPYALLGITIIYGPDFRVHLALKASGRLKIKGGATGNFAWRGGGFGLFDFASDKRRLRIHVGPILGVFGVRLENMWDPFWGFWGPFGKHVGPILCSLGSLL